MWLVQVLLTQIKTPSRGSTSNGVMQLVVPSFDGGMYIFDGKVSAALVLQL